MSAKSVPVIQVVTGYKKGFYLTLINIV